MGMPIYLDDLKPEAREKVLEFLGLPDAGAGNLDVVPLFELERPEDEQES